MYTFLFSHTLLIRNRIERIKTKRYCRYCLLGRIWVVYFGDRIGAYRDMVNFPIVLSTLLTHVPIIEIIVGQNGIN